MNKALESVGPSEKLFVFVDEGQYEPKWLVALKIVYDRTANAQVFATGSPALTLQSSVDMARRARFGRVLPLSYPMYMRLKNEAVPDEGLREEIREAIFYSSAVGEAYKRLSDIRTRLVPYISFFAPFRLEGYLKTGSLPFTLAVNEEGAVFDGVRRMLDKVIFKYRPALGGFDIVNQVKIFNLLTLLAVSDRTNLDKLASSLKVSKPILISSIDALGKSDLIYKVWPYGSKSSAIRKTPKYKFSAPVLRSASLWEVGGWADTPDKYGVLFEDTVSKALYRLLESRTVFSLSSDPIGNNADSVVGTGQGSNVVVDAGYGPKGSDQVLRSANKV